MNTIHHKDINSLIKSGALFVSNHSGGKDSQTMLIKLLEVIPPKQIVVVHASLGAMEWPGALELAEKQAGQGAQDPAGDGGATLCEPPRSAELAVS